MPLCGNPIVREHSARTSGNVTLRREAVSLANQPREAGDSVLVKTEPVTSDE